VKKTYDPENFFRMNQNIRPEWTPATTAGWNGCASARHACCCVTQSSVLSSWRRRTEPVLLDTRRLPTASVRNFERKGFGKSLVPGVTPGHEETGGNVAAWARCKDRRDLPAVDNPVIMKILWILSKKGNDRIDKIFRITGLRSLGKSVALLLKCRFGLAETMQLKWATDEHESARMECEKPEHFPRPIHSLVSPLPIFSYPCFIRVYPWLYWIVTA